MTSLTESFKSWKHTPLYENEQNEKEIFQWRLLEFIQKEAFERCRELDVI